MARYSPMILVNTDRPWEILPRDPRFCLICWCRERLLRKCSIALGQAIDISTWENYGSALNSYLTFVHIHNFPVEPTADTISFFTVFMCHHIKPDSVDTYLSGICQQLKPYFPAVRDIHKSILCKRTLTGCKHLRGVPTKWKWALTLHDLHLVINHYSNSTSHDNLLFVSQLITGFFALMRLGELTVSDYESLFDHRKITSRTSVSVSDDNYCFFLPSHKADKFFEGNIVIIQQHFASIDPLTFFKKYLKSRDRLFPFSPDLWLHVDGSRPSQSFFIHRMRLFFSDNVAGLANPCTLAVLLPSLSKCVSIATPELWSFGDSEMSCVNGHGFNFDVAPSLVGIWCPLISRVGDVGDVGGPE